MTFLTNFFSSSLNTFKSLQFADIIDILIVAFALYLVFLFIRQSRSYFIIYSVLFLLVVSYIAKTFNLSLTRQLFQPLLTFIILIFVVVFQRDIRKFFEWFSHASQRMTAERRISLSVSTAKSIVDAVFEMAGKKIGAIIVFEGDYPLDNTIAGGFALDGKITKPLLLSIFDTSSPGHDGAVMILNNRIKRFGVHLPLASADNYGNFSTAGTRHRATAGITERTDALAVVVSEERGVVSVSTGGVLRPVTRPDELEKIISDFMKENILEEASSTGWSALIKKNLWIKVISLVLAVSMWFIFVFQLGVISQDFSVPIEARYLPSGLTFESYPKETTVTLSGNYGDLHNLSPKEIKVIVDLSSAHAGWQTVELAESNVDRPNYLTLTRISAKSVNINLVEDRSLNINPIETKKP